MQSAVYVAGPARAARPSSGTTRSASRTSGAGLPGELLQPRRPPRWSTCASSSPCCNRQLARMTRIDELLDALPPGVTFDLAPDQRRHAHPPGRTSWREALAQVARPLRARLPGHLRACAFFCRDEAAAAAPPTLLGRSVRDELGGVESIADGARPGRAAPSTPAPGQEEIAGLLRARGPPADEPSALPCEDSRDRAADAAPRGAAGDERA